MFKSMWVAFTVNLFLLWAFIITLGMGLFQFAGYPLVPHVIIAGGAVLCMVNVHSLGKLLKKGATY